MHTPGPWSQSHRERPGGSWATEVYDAQGETIATLAWHPVRSADHPGSISTDRDANAVLIAAAPDLLAVAQMLVADYAKATCGEDMNPPIAEARAAIAKATGTAL